MNRLEEPSRNSWLMQVVGPVLIILMVGSLVFFFIEVFYRGPHEGRLRWVLGLFTLASVLVSRISIQEGFQRASVFGWLLAIATFITSIQLVQFSFGAMFLGPFMIVALIVLVMWSSSKLTWDCTVIDRSRDVSAIGLTEIVRRKLGGTGGFRGDLALAKRESGGTADTAGSDNSHDDRVRSTAGDLIQGLMFSSTPRGNTPGLWVFYFSMFAFPVFGFGQWFVQRDPNNGFRSIFILFAVYLGAGLCLLMTTSLLGLERYLRKRNLTVPEPVARQWMIVGVSVALLVMMLVLLIPRPSVSYGTDHLLAWFSSPARSSSRLAPGEDGQQQKEDATNTRISDKAEKQTDADSKNSGGQQESNKPRSSSPGKTGQQNKGNSGKGSGSQQPPSDGKTGGRQTPPAQGEKQKPPNDNSDRQSGNSDTDPEKSKGPKSRDQRNREARQNNRVRANQQPAAAEGPKSNSQPKNQSKSGSSANSAPRQSQPSGLARVFAGFAKLVVYGVGLVALAIVCAMFRGEIRDFLTGLFGNRKKLQEEIEPISTADSKPAVPPFSQFRDPFSAGEINRRDPQQVIEYTFSALQAWGRESGIHRDAQQTPYEYAVALSAKDGQLGDLSKSLADLHGRSLFGNQIIGRQELKPLIKLWRHMNSTHIGK